MNALERVLIVDDDEGLRESIAAQLVRRRIVSVTASSGQDALDKIAQTPGLEVVVTDFHMPNMNGLELTRQIKSLAPRLIKVIMMTDEWDEKMRTLAQEAGVDYPFDKNHKDGVAPLIDLIWALLKN